MSDRIRLHGTVNPAFEQVRAEFAAVLAEDAAPGAQLAVYQHGRQVVDLWGGDRVTGDSLHALYSAGKGGVYLMVALLVQDGVLDLETPVAEYWPEFAAEGKALITLRDLLSHSAGLIGIPGGFSTPELADDRALARRLAGQRPYWPPGSRYGYHAFVIGALAGEVVRRATGQTIQTAYERRIRVPYELDLYLGLPAELEPRYVPVEPVPPVRVDAAAVAPPPAAPLTRIAFNLNATPPTDLVEFANTRSVRALGPTSSGSVGNARGLARMYAAAISPVDDHPPLLEPDTLDRFTTVHTRGVDVVTGERDHFLVGFEAQHSRYPGLGVDAFGHSGAAGTQSFADPRSGLAYAYTRRQFASAGGGGAVENHRLVAAVLTAAGVSRPVARSPTVGWCGPEVS